MKQNSPSLIEATANAIKDHFVPKDKTEKSFNFHFTIPPSANYRAFYERDDKGSWVLSKYEEDRVGKE